MPMLRIRSSGVSDTLGPPNENRRNMRSFTRAPVPMLAARFLSRHIWALRCAFAGVFASAIWQPGTHARHANTPFVTVRHDRPVYHPHMDLRTVQAMVRFGMGPAGAEPPPADPSAWLLDQLCLLYTSDAADD